MRPLIVVTAAAAKVGFKVGEVSTFAAAAAATFPAAAATCAACRRVPAALGP